VLPVLHVQRAVIEVQLLKGQLFKRTVIRGQLSVQFECCFVACLCCTVTFVLSLLCVFQWQVINLKKLNLKKVIKSGLSA